MLRNTAALLVILGGFVGNGSLPKAAPAQEPMRPLAPEAKVLFVYDTRSPADSVQHKVYDVRAGGFDATKVTGFLTAVEGAAPQFSAYVKDVERYDQVRSLVERETERVRQLPAKAFSDPANAAARSPEEVQRLRVVGDLLEEFKIYDAQGNRLRAAPPAEYSTAISGALPEPLGLSPEAALRRQYEGELLAVRAARRNLNSRYGDLQTRRGELNGRAGDLQRRNESNQPRLDRVNQLTSELQKLVAERSQYIQRLNFSVTVLGQSRTYTYNTNPEMFNSDTYLANLNRRINEVQVELVAEQSRANQSSIATGQLQRRYEADDAALRAEVQRLDAESANLAEQEQRLREAISQRLNAKSHGDHE